MYTLARRMSVRISLGSSARAFSSRSFSSPRVSKGACDFGRQTKARRVAVVSGRVELTKELVRSRQVAFRLRNPGIGVEHHRVIVSDLCREPGPVFFDCCEPFRLVLRLASELNPSLHRCIRHSVERVVAIAVPKKALGRHPARLGARRCPRPYRSPFRTDRAATKTCRTRTEAFYRQRSARLPWPKWFQASLCDSSGVTSAST